VPTIAGEIKRHFRDRGWMLRVPRDVQELNARLTRTREALTRDLGRSPTVDELAAGAQASVDQVVEALSAGEAYRMMSLDEPLADGIGALEAIGENDQGFERTEQRLMLRRGFDELAPREREILRLRFFEGLTQREIADEVGISQMHVSRLIRRSVDALRDTIVAPIATAA
jgi:RNA polymerase sigma-B factor